LKLFWFVIGIFSILVLLFWAFYPILFGSDLVVEPEPVVERECLSGYVTMEGPYGQRLVIGDMEICGVDMEIGNIIGPSKLYDPGDPL